MTIDDERIALFLDFENLAIGAREGLGGATFDLGPVADALAERGRVVVRRAYADWSYFEEERRMLARHHVELIEIPQRMGASRKNAADIKMAVDAIELAYEREYVTTFVICTGDSDFTPLVHKLRELNKRVIGVGVQSSTSAMLPPACDEFLFYERLEGVEVRPGSRRRNESRGRGKAQEAPAPIRAAQPVVPVAASSGPVVSDEAVAETTDDNDLGLVVTRTLAGLQRNAEGPVLASMLKRAILRKDPTFDEGEQGFRGFGELLRHLEAQRVIELRPGSAKGDPEVGFPTEASAEDDAFALLAEVVGGLQAKGGPPQLSGLKNQLRKRLPDFSEKRFGFGGFLQFCKAARARGIVEMEWDDAADDYLLRVPAAAAAAGGPPVE